MWLKVNNHLKLKLNKDEDRFEREKLQNDEMSDLGELDRRKNGYERKFNEETPLAWLS